jgi:hypothetical protein
MTGSKTTKMKQQCSSLWCARRVVCSLANCITAAGLNWDAFPEPPPEAANWQADPDLIARPGIMKDNRFAKDSYAREKRAALRRDLRFHTQGYTSIKVGSTSGTTSPAVSSACTTHPPGGGWPTQIPRHLGVEHIMVRAASPSTNNTIAGPIDDRAPTSFPVLEAQLESTCTAALGSKVAAPNVSKSTVTEALTETMLIRGIFPEKTHASAPISPRALSSEKENIPAWAISLEKLLAEGTSSKPASASMPPPLRQSLKISTIPEGQAYIYQDGDLSLPAGSHRSFTSLEADYEAAMEASLRVSGASVWASIDHEDNVNDNVLAWQLATADVGIDDAKEVSQITISCEICLQITGPRAAREDVS